MITTGRINNLVSRETVMALGGMLMTEEFENGTTLRTYISKRNLLEEYKTLARIKKHAGITYEDTYVYDFFYELKGQRRQRIQGENIEDLVLQLLRIALDWEYRGIGTFGVSTPGLGDDLRKIAFELRYCYSEKP